VELTGYASIARRWWRRILAATVAGALIGLVAVPFLPPTYEAQARLLIGPVNTDLDTQRSAGSLARTYADLVLSRSVLEPIARQFGLSVEDLEEQTRTTASEATRFVTIVVEDTSREVAAGAANEMAAKLIEFAGQSPNPEGAVTIVDAAELPEDPSAPSVPLVVALTTSTGFVTAMLILILVESFSRMVRDQDDIVRLVDVPVVAVLAPRAETSGATRAADLAMVTGRLIASSRIQANVRVAVAGTRAGQASAGAAARLAAELAAFGGRVSVIDAGTGRVAPILRAWSDPAQTRRTTSGSEGGEVESLRLDNGWIRVVHRLSREDRQARGPVQSDIGAGSAASTPGIATLSVSGIPMAFAPAASVASTLAAAEETAGVTVIHVDSPTSSAAALRWIEVAGDAIIVVGLDESRREDLHRSVEVLKVLGTEVLGIVVVPRGKLLQRFGRSRLRLGRGRRPSQSAGPAVVDIADQPPA
jgi:capsular polysaccharide biosynthesis protein